MTEIVNGVGHQSPVPGVSATTVAYISQSLNNFGTLINRIYASRYGPLFTNINNNINSVISRRTQQRASQGWNPNNHAFFADPMGLPYRRDGTLTVVISDRYTYDGSRGGPAGSLLVNGRAVQYSRTSFAHFDARYNQIVIHPFFAEAIRLGRVQYLTPNGWRTYTMVDLILHEWGHNGDNLMPNGGMTPATAAMVGNNQVDMVAERVERIGQLVDGRGVRYPHNTDPQGVHHGFRFLDEDGNPIPDTVPGLIKLRDWQRQVLGNPRLEVDEYGPAPVQLTPEQWLAAQLDQLVEAIILTPAQTISNVDGGQLGSALGSVLGQRLTSNPFGQIVASATLSTVLGAVGEFIDTTIFGGSPSATGILSRGLDSVGPAFLNNLKSAGIGAVSSLLTAEIIQALGLEGLPAEIANTAGGAVISQILTNILPGSTALSPFANIGVSLGSAIGSFLGNKLADVIHTFNNVGGQIGAAVGAAYGAFQAAHLFQIAISTGNPYIFAAAVIIVAIDKLLGGFIGSLFGGTPRSGADVAWDAGAGEFVVANVYARKGGAKQAAEGLADSVANNLNAVLEASGSLLADPAAIQLGNYGMRGTTYVYRPNSTRDKHAITARFTGDKGAEQLVTHGTYLALNDMPGQMVGGNIYVKRAIVGSLEYAGGNPNGQAAGSAGDFNMLTLLGDVSIAGDYGVYIQNRDQIHALIAADPNNTFTASWVITLARAVELGINRRGATDWTGGYEIFLDHASDGSLGGDMLSAALLRMDIDPATGGRFWTILDAAGAVPDVSDGVAGYIEDTIEVESQTTISGTDASETISLIHTATAIGRGGDLVDRSGWPADPANLPAGFASVAGWQNTTPYLDETRWASVVGPDGKETAVIEAGQQDAGPEGGGTYTNAFSIDGSKAYEFTYYFQFKEGQVGQHHVYFGLNLGSAGNSWVENPGTGDEVANPYFYYAPYNAQGSFEDGRWYKVVGYVLPENASLPTGPVGGVFDMTSGDKVADATVFRWKEDRPSDDVYARFFNFYGDTGQNLYSTYFARPEVREINESAVLGGADRLESTAGLRINGWDSDGMAVSIDVAATIDAGAGDDIVHGGDMGNNVLGGEGNDTLYGGRLDDWLLGGAGDDKLNAGADAGASLGGDGNYLDGGAGNDTIVGREGSDWLEGGEGTDTLEGGEGGDILAGGAGAADTMRGGRGDDQYLFRIGDVASAAAGDADIVRDESGLSIQNVVERVYVDSTQTEIGTLLGQALSGTLFSGGSGLGNWRGGGLQTSPAGVMTGGEDALVLGPGIGLDDIKILKSADAKDLVIELWPAGVFAGDRIVLKDWFNAFNKIETLKFADGNEVRIADFDTFILGSDGVDTIIGTPGNDFVHAGGGDDIVHLLSGNDFGNGGLGNDSVSGDSGHDIVVGADGNDQLHGGVGDDTVSGGRGADRLTGDDGRDLLSGGAGDDELIGGSGDDVFKFSRGDGRDTMIDALSNEWELVWISGQGFQNGYAMDAAGAISHATHGLLFDGQTWSARTRYEVETGLLYRHRPANADAVVADSGNDMLEFGLGIDVNDIRFMRANGDKDLLIGIEQLGGSLSSFASLTDEIRLAEWGPAGNAAALGSIEKFVFFNTGFIDITQTALDGGGDGNDVLNGVAGRANWITGGIGDDEILGQALDDILNGNAGRDRLLGQAGNDVLLGGDDDDVLIGGAGADTLIGGGGLEDIASYETAAGPVTASLAGGGTMTGDAAGDVYDGIEGLRGSAQDDDLDGDQGNNELDGRKGNDALRGGLGDDIYVFGRGDGSDTIRDEYVAAQETVVDSAGNLRPRYVDRLDLVDREGGLYTFAHVVADSETGAIVYRRELPPTADADPSLPTDFVPGGWDPDYTVNGNEVADVEPEGPAGDDVLQFEDYTGEAGYTGEQTIGLADLRFAFEANDLLISLVGNPSDQVRIRNFRNGAAVDVNRAIETIQFSDGSSVRLAGLKFDASGNLLAASGDTAEAPADTLIVGIAAGETLTGGFGSDALSGIDGNDVLLGGDGDDLLAGGAGGDQLRGGAGIDWATYLSSDAAITVNLATHTLASGGATGTGSEALGDKFESVENVIGSHFADSITGDAAANVLKGNRGNDTLAGAAGDDVLIGHDGNDVLTGALDEDNLDGGTGNDTLDGGAHSDALAGGEGNDILRGDGTSGADLGGNILVNGSFEDSGGAGDDVAQSYGLTTGDLPGWTPGAARPLQLATSASGITPANGARMLHLDDGTGNVAVSQTITDMQAGDFFRLTFNSATRTSAASGAYEVLWNGKVVLTVTNSTSAMAARTINDLVAIEGDNVLTFRGLGAVDGLGAVIDNAQLVSTGGSDELIGGAGADRLEGGNSNDVLIGGDGDDSSAVTVQATTGGLYGGKGDDILEGGSGNDTLDGGAGNDSYVFQAGSGDDVVIVGGGNDDLIFDGLTRHQLWFSQVAATQDLLITAVGGGASVRVTNWFVGGTNQARRIIAGEEALSKADVQALVTAMAGVSATVPATWPAPNQALSDALAAAWQPGESYVDRAVIRGTASADTLTFDPMLIGPVRFEGLAGNDTITAGDTDDTILGGSGDDTSRGGGGNDMFRYVAETGFDTVDGGDGEDVLIADAAGARIDLRSLVNVEAISGNGFANVTIGVASGATLDFTNVAIEGIVQIGGSSGIETITGSAGNDIIIGGSGNDTLRGGGGDDVIRGGAGTDTLDGGDGIDTVDQSDITVAQAIDFVLNQVRGAATEAATGFENAIGGSGVDTIIGSAGANRLDGRSGNDTIDAGDGDDVLIGGVGGDALKGGAGIDTASYETMATASSTTSSTDGITINGVRINLLTNSSTNGSAPATGLRALQGDAASDWFYQVENIRGSNFSDWITGDNGANLIAGGGASDALYGGLGDDLLSGDAGNDVIDGDGGIDTAVYAGNRADYLIDTVNFTVRDINTTNGDDGLDSYREIEKIQFADVTISLGIDPTNGPRLGAPSMADQSWDDGVAATYQIPDTAFFDLDLGDSLTFSATLADGGPLPAWLVFNPATRSFAGTPPLAAIGTVLEVKVTAEDQGLSVSDNFLLTIAQAPGANILGGASADILSGTFRAETVIALAGNDTIHGSAGADILDGGADQDIVDYGASAEGVVIDLSDEITSGGDADGDTLISIEGVGGSALADTLIGSAAMNTFYGQGEDDVIDGKAGDDLIVGGAGIDTLSGGSGNDSISARSLAGGALEDVIDGGDGIDTLILADSENGATVDLTSERFASIEHVVGSGFADTLTGDSFTNSLSGGLGNDVIAGGHGSDTLYGGGGNDTLDGGAGSNFLYGEDGDDHLTGGEGGDTFYGGAGNDTVAYRASLAGVTVNLTTNVGSGGDATSDTYAIGSIESVDGSDFLDTITGSGAANILKGFAGDDVILGQAGDDMLDGGDGIDTLSGDDGIDNLLGGAGDDVLHGNAGDDIVKGGDGQDTLYGDDGADRLEGEAGNDVLHGGTGADTILGGDGDDDIHLTVPGEDSIDGGAGEDRAIFTSVTGNIIVSLSAMTGVEQLLSGSGNDVLTGSAAANRIDGGLGDDIVEGRAGADTLIGGAGTDTLSYANSGTGATIGLGAMGAVIVNGQTVVAAVSRSVTGVDVNLTAGTAANADAAGDVISGFENARGSAHADRLRGTDASSRIDGGAGDDVIYGGAGGDTLNGEDGDDMMYGEAGVDILDGGAGNDRLFGGGESDQLIGGQGDDVLDAGDAGDVLDGGAGADIMVGGLGEDAYKASATSGADIIYNYDTDGSDDSIVYDANSGVTNTDLWFSKGPGTRDLIVKVLGTGSSVTIKDWFANNTAGNFTPAGDEFLVDMIVAGAWTANKTVNVPTLISIMAGMSEPASFASLSPAIQNQISGVWSGNTPPTVTPNAGNPTSVAEDGAPVDLYFTVNDLETAPAVLEFNAGTTGVATSVQVIYINETTRAVRVTPIANKSGTDTITVTVSEAGGVNPVSYVVNNFTVSAVADGVNLGAAAAIGGNLDTAISLGAITAALRDNDGSEQLYDLRVEDIPIGARIASGANSFTATAGSTGVDIKTWNLSTLTITPPPGSGVNFTLRLTARSREGSSGPISTTDQRTIIVDVNGRPTGATIDHAVPRFPENVSNPAGVLVGTLSAVDPDDANIGQYSFTVIGAETSRFQVIGAQLWLKPNVALDFEDGDIAVGIRVTDTTTGTALTRDTSVLVRPANTNEPPHTFTDENVAANAVAENAGAGALVGVTARAIDPEGLGLTYSLTANPFGWFTINSTTGVVTWNAVADQGYERTTNGQVTITVQASDGVSTASSDYTINIIDVNEAPSLDASSFTLSEAAGGGANLGITAKPLASDLDFSTSENPAGATGKGEDSHRFSIIGGTGFSLFTIDAITGNISTAASATFNYEAATSYTLTIQVRDMNGTGLTASADWTVNIQNQGPSQPAAVTDTYAVEGGPLSIALSGSNDPGGGEVNYDFASGGNPGGYFAIDNVAGNTATLRLATAVDFEIIKTQTAIFSLENPNRGYVTVKVVGMDPASMTSAERSIRVYFDNANDNDPTQPGVTAWGATSFAENTGAGAVVATLSTSDADGSLNALSYELTSNPGGMFVIVGNQVRVGGANFDFEALGGSLNVGVRATDGTRFSPATNFNVQVSNVDDLLPIGDGVTMQNGYTTTLTENSVTPGVVFARAAAHDGDGIDTITYSLLNNPGGAFVINASTGEIYTASGIDYEAFGPANLGADGNVGITLSIRAAQSGDPGRYVDQNLALSIADVPEFSYIYSGGSLPATGTINFGNGYGYKAGFSGGLSNLVYYRRIFQDTNGNGVIGDGTDLGLAGFNDNTNPQNWVLPGYRWGSTAWESAFLRELPPIVLDLNGDGEVSAATIVSFDVDGDGVRDRTGWIGSGDGLLALDRDGNGLIDRGAEISFMADKEGAATDLEGLSAYDSNGDGRFDAGDARFADFRIWRDRNSDGISQADELGTLAEAGIAGIALAGIANAGGTPDTASVTLLATTHFTRSDGSTGLAGDLALRWTDGFDVIRQSSAAAGAAGAALAIDREGDGVIDPASELIGAGAPLAAFDSNGDGIVSALDLRYFDLRLWRDRNGNGRTEPDELTSLDRAGLDAVDVDAPDLRTEPVSAEPPAAPATPPAEAPATPSSEPVTPEAPADAIDEPLDARSLSFLQRMEWHRVDLLGSRPASGRIGGETDSAAAALEARLALIRQDMASFSAQAGEGDRLDRRQSETAGYDYFAG